MGGRAGKFPRFQCQGEDAKLPPFGPSSRWELGIVQIGARHPRPDGVSNQFDFCFRCCCCFCNFFFCCCCCCCRCGCCFPATKTTRRGDVFTFAPGFTTPLFLAFWVTSDEGMRTALITIRVPPALFAFFTAALALSPTAIFLASETMVSLGTAFPVRFSEILALRFAFESAALELLFALDFGASGFLFAAEMSSSRDLSRS